MQTTSETISPPDVDPKLRVASTPGETEREPAPLHATDEALVEDDLLIEDVSIDGMCGVY